MALTPKETTRRTKYTPAQLATVREFIFPYWAGAIKAADTARRSAEVHEGIGFEEANQYWSHVAKGLWWLLRKAGYDPKQPDLTQLEEAIYELGTMGESSVEPSGSESRDGMES